MKLYLEEIGADGKEFSHSFSFDAEGISGTVTKFEGSVYAASGSYFLDGNVEVTFKLDCDRCLKPYQASFSERVQLTVEKSEPEELEDGEVELKDDDLGQVFIEGDFIDLTEIARQEALLLLPVKNICKDVCKGVCPSCGADLNSGGCTCKEPSDPRWEELKRLQQKKEN